MRIRKEDVEDKDLRGILRLFVDMATKSDEEIKTKRTRGAKEPTSKVYIADKGGFQFGSLSQEVENVHARGDKNARKFFNKYPCEEDTIDDNISFVKIYNTEYDREHRFVFVDRGKYLWILTTETRENNEKTIENLIKYLPGLERVYLSSENLEGLREEFTKDTRIAGFTAKYRSHQRERDATLQLHGAEDDDIQRAKEAFQATPTRIAINQKNSPATSVQISNTNDGYLNIESIRSGSEEQGTDTVEEMLSYNEEHDSRNFEVEHRPVTQELENGFGVSGFTTVRLVDPKDIEGEGVEIVEGLEDSVLSKRRYSHGRWDDKSLFVQDKHHGEVFEVAVEGSEIAVHACETTTSLSIRCFCRNVSEMYNSTYSIEMNSGEITGSTNATTVE